MHMLWNEQRWNYRMTYSDFIQKDQNDHLVDYNAE